jgi:hypothetical protein
MDHATWGCNLLETLSLASCGITILHLMHNAQGYDLVVEGQ